MEDYAILTNSGEYSIFKYNNQIIRFTTSDRLEKYTKVLEWDKGYIVVMAKYKDLDEILLATLDSNDKIMVYKKGISAKYDTIFE